jgi:hypothetical protein
VRNYAASLGLAILGTTLVDQLRGRITSSLVAQGLSRSEAATEAAKISQSQGGRVGAIPHFVRLDFAYASRTVFYAMAGIMAVAAIVARFGLQSGRQELTNDPDETLQDRSPAPQ